MMQTLSRHVRVAAVVAAGLAIAGATRVCAQGTADPFPPIAADGAIVVNIAEFAVIPDINGEAPRMMTMVDEPGTRRLFVSTMRGPVFSVSYDGRSVTPYLDVNDPKWNVPVQSNFSERGVQSLAFHPQFSQRGAKGYGKFYTHLDTSRLDAKPDFVTPGSGRTHDTVLLEWTAKDPAAATYDGDAPRELFRMQQPFPNHNGGMVAFNPLTPASSAEFGLLYVGVADGGSGGDPMNLAQNLSSAFGKILRIDPLGKNSSNGKYGIPASNPFVSQAGALGEIYAYGVRNPQRFSWDPKTGQMYVADIGQNIVEEVSPVTAGANLGWNVWEGSFTYGAREVGTANRRGDPKMTYPVAEYDHRDPLLNRPAVTGVYVYRQGPVRALANRLIFGDNPSGEVFTVGADAPPTGGSESIRRVLFNDKGPQKTLLQLIRERNAAQGRPQAPRADLRMAMDAQGRLFLMNKRDGLIRVVVP